MGDPDSKTREDSIEFRDKIVKPALGSNFRIEDFLGFQGDQKAIHSKMRDLTRNADLCIADLTGNNPNVFFEYGQRMANGRPVLALIRKGEKLAYDVSDFPTNEYDVVNPKNGVHAIEEYAREFFGEPTLKVSANRIQQSTEICEYISNTKPKQVDILQCSLLALMAADGLFEALWASPETKVRLLLMDPDYGLEHFGKDCEKNIRQATDAVRDLAGKTKSFARHEGIRCPTVGLWYYKHDPSVAVVIVDDQRVQLGWYLQQPWDGVSHRYKVRLRGGNQPSVLAWADDASVVLGPIREHFEIVLKAAEWQFGVGEGHEKMRLNWEETRGRTGSVRE